jgi:crossover junction endodeoxyribonuclease RuvC
LPPAMPPLNMHPLAPNPAPHLIMGVDPGTVAMGFAIVACAGQTISLKHMGVLKMSHTHNVFERLQRIFSTIEALIAEHKPSHFAIEAPFFGKNVQSMLKLGRAQGVAIACAMHHGVPVAEYAPKTVKQAVTGNGNADKERVWAMLQRLMHVQEAPHSYDATDALAVAVCHHFQMQSPLAGFGAAKGNKSWQAFIAQHPQRVSAK